MIQKTGKLRTSSSVALTITALITAAGLYIGIADDNWGWIPYALFTLIIGLILLKRGGTINQVRAARYSLRIFIIIGVVLGLLFLAYLSWMSGFTF